MLKIENLKKAYKKNIVFENLNFQIHQGELIYIHGINGSGKSTLFKLICGISEKDDGTIIKDNNIEIGALIENPGFLENETLRFNLKFLASLKNHYDEQKISNLCEAFHLDYHNKAKLKEFSLGMKQKAGIIQAIMENQDLILLDEPTRGLDNEAIQTFCQIINDLHNNGKTIIIAAHDYLESLPFDKHYHLVNGELIEE